MLLICADAKKKRTMNPILDVRAAAAPDNDNDLIMYTRTSSQGLNLPIPSTPTPNNRSSLDYPSAYPLCFIQQIEKARCQIDNDALVW